jgi:hypothetical protein
VLVQSNENVIDRYSAQIATRRNPVAEFEPPYDLHVPVPEKFADTPFDELPEGLKRRISRFSRNTEAMQQAQQADVPQQETVHGEAQEAAVVQDVPVEEPQAQPEQAGQVGVPEAQVVTESEQPAENVDQSGDPIPEGVEFPHHKGGGYYVLSDGQVVRGEDEAAEAQANLS